ncbi:MAG: Dabb family protein [Balneolaceae bacterium]
MNTLILSLIVILGAAFAANTQAQGTQSSDNESALVHTVYFWFNDDVSEEDHQNFYQELKKLKQIPQIREGWIGVPADTEERGVIDNTYDYSITFVFDNKEAEAEYQVHPIHLDFVETNADLWENVVVYDATTP